MVRQQNGATSGLPVIRQLLGELEHGDEIEAPPQLIPERHAIEDHPAHDFGALSHMLCSGQGRSSGSGTTQNRKLPFPSSTWSTTLMTWPCQAILPLRRAISNPRSSMSMSWSSEVSPTSDDIFVRILS